MLQIFFLLICAIAYTIEPLKPVDGYQDRLDHLKLHIDRELQLLDYPRRPWLQIKKTSGGEHIYDVVIVGGGQTGMTLAFALRKEKVTNLIIFDENEEGFEGPWMTYAHMEALRSPKYVLGPDCNVPSLTCQEWFEAKYGEEEWAKLRNVPRVLWSEYLRWYRKSLNLPVVNETKVGALHWDENENCFIVPIQKDGEFSNVYARKVILATGFQGSGEWTVPTCVKDHLPKTLYSSVYENIDFEHLKGKKVGILGGGPCAFDAAIMCHNYGAEEIHMFFKRPKLANLHAFRWGEYVGFLNHFTDLPDDDKWKFISKIYEMGQPPTPDGVAKVKTFNNVIYHFDSPWMGTEDAGDHALVVTPQEKLAYDHLLVATGWIADLTLRHELAEFCPKIALWKDRFTPPESQEYPYLLRMPYLGRNFEFIEKEPGSAPFINSIFNCTGGALLSAGFNAGTGLIGMKYSVQKVVYGIVKELFLEDKEFYYQSLENYQDALFEN